MVKLLSISFLLIFSSILLLFFSCNSSDRINSQLQGKWKLIDAYRNGRRTSTMENVYFNFWNKDSIETNIPISEKLIYSSYKLDGNDIVLSSDLEKFYVDKISNDTLQLQTNISNYIFSFLLIKNKSK